MKKISKKIVSKVAKVIGVFILIAVVLYTTISTAMAAPKSITIANSALTQAYMNMMKISKKVLTDGTYVYCLDRTLKTPSNTKETLVGEKDAGFAYLLQNGYPNKSFTGDGDKDYYITQSAVWWYLDETAGGKNLSTEFKTTVEDPHGLRPYMKALVEGAKAAKAKGYPAAPTLNLTVANKDMELSSDKLHYVSKPITGNATNIDGAYTVSITDGPSGAFITDENGNKKTSFQPGEKFLVKVPASSLSKTTTNVTVKVTAKQSYYKAYEYTTGDPSMQNTIVLFPETKEVSDEIILKVSTSKVSIVKIDEDTNNPLPGAKLELTDADGNVVTTWTSTNKAHVIQNLPDGTYYLKEVAAPKGYVLNKEPVTININENNRDIEVKMMNKADRVVINIIKIDQDTGNLLAGAVLVIKDSNGKEVAKFTTTNKPYVLLNLEYGTYTVEEVSAPDGYVLSGEVISFTVDEENQTHQIVFNNDKICGPGDEFGPNGEVCNPGTEVNVPNTMTKSGGITTILGGLLLIGTLGFLYRNGKKEQK